MSREFFGWIEKKFSEKNMEDFLEVALAMKENSRSIETKNAILDTVGAFLKTKNDYLEWCGPEKLFCVKIALLYFRRKEIHIPGHGWLFWERDVGFFGDGLTFFKKS